MWVPERVWEQHLASALAEAGIEYTTLDDFHFQRAGLAEDDLLGYYLTEDDGRLLKVFPGSERLRYLIPFQEPHASYEYLRRLAEERPGSVVVFADDGEKFGTWPEDARARLHQRLAPPLLRHDPRATATGSSRPRSAGWSTRRCPLGKVYLPDCVVPRDDRVGLPPRSRYEAAQRRRRPPPAARVRAGGFWRNFKAKYAETDEMYARMLEVSNRLAALEANPEADPDYLDAAQARAVPGPVQLPLLARRLRRALPAPPAQRRSTAT